MNQLRTPCRRIDSLRDGLLDSVRLLKARRASDIPDGFIDDYVALSWLEWHGGALRLTTVGENIARQVSDFHAEVPRRVAQRRVAGFN